MRTEIIGKTFDAERALYPSLRADIADCTFAGPADGESVLKESRDISVRNCSFSLRYPLWHVDGFTLSDSSLNGRTRAAIWYSRDGLIRNSRLHGVKAVRECENIAAEDSDVLSPEFGWKSAGIALKKRGHRERIPPL